MTQVQSHLSREKIAPPTGDLASVIHQCFQCCKCSAGCPVAPEMDLLPHQLVRLAVLGEVDRIVSSRSIWLCLTCHTCGARCPNGIDVPALLDPIRHQVISKKLEPRESRVPLFHEVFMKTVQQYGRVHELSLIGMYKVRTGTYFDDMELGWKMFRKGKMHLLPRKSPRLNEVREVFKESSFR
jgi:heterodisulfide reductase subunit C2